MLKCLMVVKLLLRYAQLRLPLALKKHSTGFFESATVEKYESDGRDVIIDKLEKVE